MIQIGRRGTARRFCENFEKFSKSTEFEFQNSGPSFLASMSPVYCKKNYDSIRTKLTEEIHFEVCHSGNLPPIIACCVSTGDRRAGAAATVTVHDVRIQKCCVRIIPRILTRDPRTGGIQNWGRNRAVKNPGLLLLIVVRQSLAVMLGTANYLWSPYEIGQTIIFSSCGFFFLLRLLLFPRLMSAVADWMSAILSHIVWP